MQDYYTLQVAGVTRQLPIMQISDSLAIASFVILGDCEIVTKSAPLIEKQLPQVDYIVTAEAKGIPLVHELCRLRGLPYYIVARKSVKPYMSQPLTDEVVSITTQKAQTLCLDGKDALLLKGKRWQWWTTLSPPANRCRPLNAWWKRPAAKLWPKLPSWQRAMPPSEATSSFWKSFPCFLSGAEKEAGPGARLFLSRQGAKTAKETQG